MTREWSGYTSHGHAIEGLLKIGKPEKVARCGGPGLCRVCSQDVVTARNLAVSIPIPTSTHVLMVYRHKTVPNDPWKVMLVSPENSAITDGTYDLIEHYRNNGRWDVHTQTIELPE